MPLIFWAVTAFSSGAWIGSIVNNATAQPTVNIEQGVIKGDKEEGSTARKIIIFGATGLIGWLIWRNLK